jgi:choline dehydrogenase-like flavoprotein
VVKEIAVDGSGRATGVVFVDRETKAIEEARARTVALCASTIESTRILLNSKSAAHPGGLGASSGVLGRYLMDHPAIHLTGFMPGERDVAWTDGYAGPKNIMIPRFRNLTNKSSGKFLRGWGAFGHVGRWVPPADCEPSEVPVSLVAYGEMLPRQHNQVRLVNDEVDAWGIPIVEIDCAFSDNEVAMQDDMEDTLSDLLEAAGGRVKEVARIAPGGFVHEMGTARMGDRPSNSVVNRFGPWQNPTLTMMAFAGLACRHLATELRR